MTEKSSRFRRLEGTLGSGLSYCVIELGLVTGTEPVARNSLRPGDKLSKRGVRLGRVGQELKPVRRVEPDQVADRPARSKQRAKATVGEDALDEALSDPRVVEPALFLDGKAGVPAEERVGEFEGR